MGIYVISYLVMAGAGLTGARLTKACALEMPHMSMDQAAQVIQASPNCTLNFRTKDSMGIVCLEPMGARTETLAFSSRKTCLALLPKK